MNMNKMIWTFGSLIGAQQALKALHRLEVDDVLGTVGLEKRRGTAERVLPTLGLMSLAAATGAACALLMAPSSGRELRGRVTRGLDDAKRRVNARLEDMGHSANEAHHNGS